MGGDGREHEGGLPVPVRVHTEVADLRDRNMGDLHGLQAVQRIARHPAYFAQMKTAGREARPRAVCAPARRGR